MTSESDKLRVLSFAEDSEFGSLYDNPDFLEYCKQIEAVIRDAGGRGATIADIHRKLGRDRIRWTMDALNWIGVEEHMAAPTRYRLVTGKPIQSRSWSNGLLFSPKKPARPKTKA